MHFHSVLRRLGPFRLVLLATVVWMGVVPRAHAATSLIQVAAGASSGSTKTFSVSFSQSTGVGDTILVGFDFDPSATFSSISDSQGNTFTEVGTQLTTPGGAHMRVYYARSVMGGPETVTITLSANAGMEVYLAEYAGLDPTNPIDAQAGASGNAGAVSSGSVTTTVAGDVIYGYCLADWKCTVGSGFTARSTLDSNLLEDKTAANPGAYAATGTATNGWAMQMVALNPPQHPIPRHLRQLRISQPSPLTPRSVYLGSHQQIT